MLGIVVDWLAGQNGPWGLGAALALTAVLTGLNQYRIRREKLLSFRIRFNSRLGFDPPDAGDVVQLLDIKRASQTAARLLEPGGAGTDTMRIVDLRDALIPSAGMIVFRIKNVGRTPIRETDWERRVPLGIEVADSGPRIVTCKVTEAKPASVADMIKEDGGPRIVAGKRVVLPHINLNPGSEFKVVALLANAPAAGKPTITQHGEVTGGRVLKDADAGRMRRTTLIGGALCALLAGALVVVLVLRNADTPVPPPIACATGDLRIQGSSAFAGAVEQIAAKYTMLCPGARITVAATGSFDGLNQLADAPADQRAGTLALADGRFTDFDQLRIAGSLAVIPYAFVVGAGWPVDEVSQNDLVRIFNGEVTDWSQVRTATPPATGEIVVISRDTQSGSRRVVENALLGPGKSLTGKTSDNCEQRRAGVPATDPVICELSATSAVLGRVAARPGAIGYVDTPNAISANPPVKRLRVSGHGSTIDDVRNGYPFWTVEYLYTYGELSSTSELTRSFVTYLAGREAASAIGQLRYTPCVRSDGTPEVQCDK